MLSVVNIAETYETARRYTRVHARSFYFASHILPEEKRHGAYSVYAFCRFADNLVDGSATGDARRSIILLREQLRSVYEQPSSINPGLRSFADTVHRFGIPEQYFEDLLRGMEMDLTRSRYADFTELRDYCYCVASVVGLILTKLFRVVHPEAEPHAIDLGIAMQLTNILRDIREDLGRGRIYLPQLELDRSGVTEDELRQGAMTEHFRQMMRIQIERARSYYSNGMSGLRYLPDDGSRTCVRLMSSVYAGILNQIERQNYDVFSRRASVSPWQKLLIAFSGNTQTTSIPL